MTTSPTPPTLADHRDAARDRLNAFYAPHAAEMETDRSVAAFEADPAAWQRKYEASVVTGRVESERPAPVRVLPSGYPDPVEYLVTQFQWEKTDELFHTPAHRGYVGHLCRLRGASRQWIEGHLDDVLNETTAHLLSSHLLPAADRRKTNDYRLFLKAWADTHDLPPDRCRGEQLNLIRKPTDNTIRRMLHAESRELTGWDAADLERLAVYGERRSGTIPESIQESIQECPALTADERRVLLLKLVEGYVFEEIAVIMGRPLGTVYGIYRRGLRKLLDDLEPGS